MTAPDSAADLSAPSSWDDAGLAAALFAVDPVGTAGTILRARPGPVRDRWLALLRALLPADAVVRRVPLHIGDERLLGGLDLPATLATGRPVAARGLLVEADGGVLLLAMAERLPSATAARLAAVLDSGEVRLERDGFAACVPTRFGVVALDEGADVDEKPPSALADRLAFSLDLNAVSLAELEALDIDAADVAAARARLAAVEVGDEVVAALCNAALALGVPSVRASILALRAARAAAALEGRDAVSQADAVLAGRLVLAPRATCLAAPDQVPEPAEADPTEPDKQVTPDRGADEDGPGDTPLDDLVLAAAQAAIPQDLFDSLRLAEGRWRSAGTAGRAGQRQQSKLRGRPIGTRRGDPRTGARLNVIETLRNAAPWQALRRQALQESAADRNGRIEVRRDDFRVTRFKQRSETAVLFVVDASGSSALHRLAEAKGAVELLLADCYARRDQVALLAFRGRGADLLLPPTRSLPRAKRCLAGLPGGGGTPLAAGLDAAFTMADTLRRKGQTPIVVLLTDGRANVARNGIGGRSQANEDALAAARAFRLARIAALLVDTSPQPQARGETLAREMGARYMAMPHATSASLSKAVQGQLSAGSQRPLAAPQGLFGQAQL